MTRIARMYQGYQRIRKIGLPKNECRNRVGWPLEIFRADFKESWKKAEKRL